ncbi:MAG: hypothetical protein J0I33_07650 [Microbacterium ginsengisoli]|jgi:hypothetical protein|uniref:hypothetical protein n=1 Tax=Microbacterium TaxID=33882 RepID=UPI0006FB3C89|nr:MULTISPECIES: hypothetical protein [unclassified Microbacterium]KQR97674.1 hypothetical protein ASF93_13170 [Microbacterium sp. Leaf347]KQS01700.1 hypothetical protein ASG00_09685 [Microbacterium sp. Leaf351]MBN9198498.1 hypothetical protein [Microbacterium ginsengisoli]OJU78116.1 MAG: hypothetical protein BGO15_02635 [Microbacterium sp. 71-23]
MRILTVRQPWAWAIIHGGKDVENRTRNIAGSYRGPVAIHVSGRFAEDVDSPALDDATERWHDQPEADCNRHPWRLNVGKTIGLVDLVDVHQGADCWDTPSFCSPWADGPWHLSLANPRPLIEPIPFKGALGLRHLDDDTTARILAQIGDPT